MSHPRKIHGFPGAGLAQGPPELRRAIQAITSADNYCPECFEFRGPDAQRFQLHVNAEGVRSALDAQPPLVIDDDGRLALHLNIRVEVVQSSPGVGVQALGAAAPIQATEDGVAVNVLPKTEDFAGTDVPELRAEMNAWLENWRRAGYIRRSDNG